MWQGLAHHDKAITKLVRDGNNVGDVGREVKSDLNDLEKKIWCIGADTQERDTGYKNDWGGFR